MFVYFVKELSNLLDDIKKTYPIRKFEKIVNFYEKKNLYNN